MPHPWDAPDECPKCGELADRHDEYDPGAIRVEFLCGSVWTRATGLDRTTECQIQETINELEGNQINEAIKRLKGMK